MSDPHVWIVGNFDHDPYAMTDPALPNGPDGDPEDEGYWPPRPGERDEEGEIEP